MEEQKKAETPKEDPKPEVKPNYLTELQTEKAELEKVRDEIKRDMAEFREMKAQEILSGRSNAANEQEKKKEITPQEYARKVLSGDI